MGRGLWVLTVILFIPSPSWAQQMRQPYSRQLRTDPDAGTVQAIQRYGRPLRTDPSEGDGYPIYVYPTAYSGEAPNGNQTPEAGSQPATAQGQSTPGASQALFRKPIVNPQPFNATRGLRVPGGVGVATPFAPGAVPFSQPAVFPGQVFSPQAQVFTNVINSSETITQIYHQPLIQVKVRVVEVGRSDTLEVGSVLDYISHTGKASLFTAHNINENNRRATGVTRFPAGDMLSIPAAATTIAELGTGAGGLVNLTSRHINWITTLLATELNADVITAPQVVTLNGQNVEFTSGTKEPFQLGQTVIQNSSNVIQQFFYKHVGTYVSVTPRIVDWGLHAEGKGNAAIVATEVRNWNTLIDMMINEGLTDDGQDEQWQPYVGGETLVPFKIREAVLMRLNKFTRADVLRFIEGRSEYADIFTDLVHGCGECGCEGYCHCQWKPENCTLDLEVIVRLSDSVPADLTAARGGADPSVSVSSEGNVRAVANVLQVKSGHGVVMAGLIGERDVEEAVKVPVLGDVPLVGYLFRSKTTNRQKTEVLIFIEAAVLDSCPEVARAEAAYDFQLSQPHVAGELLDSPLEFGMHRIGFGTYLPPHTHNEQVFWERLGRKIRKAATHVDDAFE